MEDMPDFSANRSVKSSEHYSIRLQDGGKVLDFIVNDGRDGNWYIVRGHDDEYGWDSDVQTMLQRHGLDREDVIEAAKQRKSEKYEYYEDLLDGIL